VSGPGAFRYSADLYVRAVFRTVWSVGHRCKALTP
jgi:hypothetical protein